MGDIEWRRGEGFGAGQVGLKGSKGEASVDRGFEGLEVGLHPGRGERRQVQESLHHLRFQRAPDGELGARATGVDEYLSQGPTFGAGARQRVRNEASHLRVEPLQLRSKPFLGGPAGHKAQTARAGDEVEIGCRLEAGRTSTVRRWASPRRPPAAGRESPAGGGGQHHRGRRRARASEADEAADAKCGTVFPVKEEGVREA